MTNATLPIWEIHHDIVDALTRGNRLVLVAPTGSGKTTQVPQMLLDAGLAEPRPGAPTSGPALRDLGPARERAGPEAGAPPRGTSAPRATADLRHGPPHDTGPLPCPAGTGPPSGGEDRDERALGLQARGNNIR